MSNKNYHIDLEQETIKAIKALKKGSAEAFQILYKKYNQKVYRFCLRMVSHEAIAKDAFQETFMKVYENRKNFRGENFAAWLFTIARHTCLNHLRAKKDHDEYDEAYHSKSITKHSDVALKDLIEQSIKQLPIQLREVIILREYEEYSYQEIANILNIELSLAKVRVHRARKILRTVLKPVVKELNES